MTSIALPLQFNEPAITSRGSYSIKPTWFITIKGDNGAVGVGECGVFPDLSIDDLQTVEEILQLICNSIESWVPITADVRHRLQAFPAILFGLESAWLAVNRWHSTDYFESEFTSSGASIPVNGLIWMGDIATMTQRINMVLAQRPPCLKIKIGAHDFAKEKQLIDYVRQHPMGHDVPLRLDANGAYELDQAKQVLMELTPLGIHSIEQPLPASQVDDLAELCAWSPIPIALDESLIGIADSKTKQHLLQQIKPSAIVIKPSLVGGFWHANEWVKLAATMGIDWWATSACESNVGLMAIAQWVGHCYNGRWNDIPTQGLGTGQLFSNNVVSTLRLKQYYLFFT